MEGVGRLREDNKGKEVISITLNVDDLELLVNSAKRAKHPNITMDISSTGFVAGESSPRAGQTFHRYDTRHWAPKAKPALVTA